MANRILGTKDPGLSSPEVLGDGPTAKCGFSDAHDSSPDQRYSHLSGYWRGWHPSRGSRWRRSLDVSPAYRHHENMARHLTADGVSLSRRLSLQACRQPLACRLSYQAGSVGHPANPGAAAASKGYQHGIVPKECQQTPAPQAPLHGIIPKECQQTPALKGRRKVAGGQRSATPG